MCVHDRRSVLQGSALGLGAIAMRALLAREARAASHPLAPRPSHFAPRAKKVIFLHMTGGPSQIDLFDPKPLLRDLDGKPAPRSIVAGKQFAFIKEDATVMGSPWTFRRHGECGMELSELLPHIGSIADEITLVRSMHTNEFNHGTAELFMFSGSPRPGRPSFGSWVAYGLGTENENLPAFVVLVTGSPVNGTTLWGSGFLPTVYQGVELRSAGDPVLYLGDPRGMSRADRADIVASVNELNRRRLAVVGDPEIATRIGQYEMAFRMQSSVPELMDISKEPRSMLELYGAEAGKASFANNCLLARRLVERGVRFVQIYDGGWDAHQNLATTLPSKARAVDRAAATLVKDLKQRGLLDETLIIWTGEFGRTPMQQVRAADGRVGRPGRDHHRDAFSLWMAGGGIRRAYVHGETDEIGFSVTKDPVHVHDLQGTMLHLLGLDHERLTYRYQGRDFRLTDVHGQVVKELLA